MKRTLWLVAGVAIGVIAVRKVNRVAQLLTPAGAAQSLKGAAGNASRAISDFAAEVREAMAERESQLRSGVGLDGKLGAKPEDF